MKNAVTSLKIANRYNDWTAYQKTGSGVGSISWKALLRPTVVEVPPTPISSVKSSVPRLSWWTRFKLFIKRLFKRN